MAEYIDREKAIEIIKSGGYWEREDMEVAIACIEQTPTADVVDVVRCKDCKHVTFYSCKNDACYKGIICEYKIGTDDENFYCIYGEKRTPKERGGEK